MSTDAADKNAKFATDEGFSFPLVCDTTRAMSIAFGAAADASAPASKRIAVLIDADGNIKEDLGAVSNPGEFPSQVLAKL